MLWRVWKQAPKIEPQHIVTGKGERTAVVLSIEAFEQHLEA